jgi:hypothetical protein
MINVLPNVSNLILWCDISWKAVISKPFLRLRIGNLEDLFTQEIYLSAICCLAPQKYTVCQEVHLSNIRVCYIYEAKNGTNT